GMIDESMDKEQMALPPQPWEFRSKPAWQRLIIMLGGVLVNFVLAFIIYIGMAYAYGDSFINNDSLKDGIWVTSPVVENAGIKTGDRIVSIDGKKVERFIPSISLDILTSKVVVVEREGTEKTINMPVNFIGNFLDSDKKGVITLRMPFVVGDVSDTSKNKAQLKAKDIIVSLNGITVKYFDQAAAILNANKGIKIPAVVLRNLKETPITVEVNNEGKLGVGLGSLAKDNLEKLGYYKISQENYSFFESIPIGIQKGKDQLVGYGKQLKMIFNPNTGAYKGVGGFAAIYNVFPSSWSWEVFWNITALLSIMLGVMNLLPIPALDGGHVMFLLYEIISGRKPSDKFLENAQMVGFFLLITLLLFANGNDIYKAIVGK
uniref:site-2 protease family protein n=1 Tax=Flavobacterium sp. TaxID=239 RepID=UPI0037BFBC12